MVGGDLGATAKCREGKQRGEHMVQRGAAQENLHSASGKHEKDYVVQWGKV